MIEVSDSTFRKDRNVKAPLYARSEIPEYWIVDLPRQRILVHRNPSSGEYQDISEIRSGDQLSPAAFPELSLPVGDIFPASEDEE